MRAVLVLSRALAIAASFVARLLLVAVVAMLVLQVVLALRVLLLPSLAGRGCALSDDLDRDARGIAPCAR